MRKVNLLAPLYYGFVGDGGGISKQGNNTKKGATNQLNEKVEKYSQPISYCEVKIPPKRSSSSKTRRPDTPAAEIRAVGKTEGRPGEKF